MSSALTDYEVQILENVKKFGCHVTTVFDPGSDDPSFTYSTGFTESVEQGEVIVFGLDHSLMHRMVNIVLGKCANGLVLTDRLPVSDVLDGFDVVAREVPENRIDREHFNSAMWFHRLKFGTDLKQAYQLVWPGAADGLFPWDSGSDPFVCGRQPALYEGHTFQ